MERKPGTRMLGEVCEATGGWMRVVVKYEQGFDFLD